ncbi:phenylacetate--CoA ligase [Geobacillus thermoleovorans]|uniref:Phenylacetate-coenzyme A ligase n=1 Tax=Geobacillus thermoleovorans TaxID=33941 RepID=A0A2Z3NA28_GEOTH|nr:MULTISPECIES: phenylacetate--CoA ligase PaaK [Geobacillus]AWO75766.1 phenylacetate--CoA ligase [Geobacillus thermoleovorans]EQB96694.1 phenylacetate-CoA ligase [Geobacillus sp. A8]OQP14237.1 phenylacetate-CoA ligase [Geobacillus thermoleovorans]QNU21617.1 phenylacetate--CoA ligase [Geobacillus thermoleovorans]GAJ58630.1 phenylacetyl-CoA ligase phenylacetic acid catabolism [Geobacillus thermoleovorans B23]
MILHDIETAARSELEAIQLVRLRATAERVYERVPFYRQRFDEKGVKPEDIRTLEDVRKLPFTTKRDLRDHYPFGLLAVDLSQCVRVHASSGTSGKPTVVAYTKQDIERWADIVARAIVIAGGKPGDVIHNAYGYGLFTGGLGLHYGSERLGAVTVPVSGGNTDRQVMIIEDFQPTVICATPSYVLNIAERMKELGKDPRQTSLKYGIFGAEPWSEEMRRTLEETFDMKACDIYGLSEVIGPGVAMECHEAQNGLHIAEDHFLVEVIDPKTLEPVAEGEEGELVFTSLTKEAFPVIRYRTGDIASVTRERCACGRTTARMSRVKGRVDDMIIIRGVNVFPSEIEHHLLRVSELAPHYQLHRLRHGHLEALELHAEVTDRFYSEVGGDLQSEQAALLARRIQSLLKTHCLISIDVRLHSPKTLPRSEGKAVRIVDRRHLEEPQSI